MIQQDLVVINMRGFTLIETIIYVGLFGILFAGVIGSTYPLFKSAEQLTAKVIDDGEGIFAAQKISMLLASSTCAINTPSAGNTGTILTVATYSGSTCVGGNTYSVTQNGGTLSLQKNSGVITPLTTARVTIANFSVKHVAPNAGIPRYIEYSFTTDNATTGPIRKYFPQIP